MRIKFFTIILLTWISCSCSTQDSSNATLKYVEIAARGEEASESKPIIYRLKVDANWIQHHPSPLDPRADTRQAIIEFYIVHQDEKVSITIHNFPSDNIYQRPSPFTYISRWKKQLHPLDPETVSLTSQAFGGYCGFWFEATGEIKGSQTTMFAWILQLAPEHYHHLVAPGSPYLLKKYRQMRSDVTIKAIGPPFLMQRYRQSIIAFARSFHLIEDL
ncbi:MULTISPECIES: hypothetical protein [unclassified Neochlamydia]|uniref:hypothetical protein n=1 Tax=unclassified Neochlamydia TaxID=2643326 RepID=UPI001BC9D745|nr:MULTISPECIES: hypothetical protein [unclassified Neochlamydia]MBS4166530.1 Uncharacterized protein [Neochlamydia sp. AcF65]